MYIAADGTATILQGSAAASGSQTAPSYGNKLVVAEVTIVNGDLSIPASRIKDVRRFINSPLSGYTPAAYTGAESVTFPNGLIMKQGTTSSPTGDGLGTPTLSVAVTFGTAFPTSCKNVQVTLRNTSGINVRYSTSVPTVTGFSIYFSESTSAVQAMSGFDWLAHGY